jgi:Bacterial pre-peptidase C-terminal domain
LASYPIRRDSLTEIDYELASQLVNSGQAIRLQWNLGNSGLSSINDIDVRSGQSGAGCFRTFCLEAPFMTDSEIGRILMSGRPIGESFLLRERGRLENSDSVMISDGSLIDRYSFTGERGQSVKINVTSPDFDTYLLLIDSDGNKIDENDDRFTSVTNSYLEITLPQTGTYTVLVNGYDSNSRGNYLVSITTPEEYATVASNSSSQRTDTRQSFNTRQTYNDLQTFAVRQILNGNQSLVTTRDKLLRAARNEYLDLPTIPVHSFIDEKFISIAEQPGALFGRRKDVSLSDYLKLKLKYEAQRRLLTSGNEIISSIDEYQKKLQNDSSGKGKGISDRIISQFQSLWNLIAEQDKAPPLSIGNFARRLTYSLEEARNSTTSLVFNSVLVSGQLAGAFSNLKGLAEFLELGGNVSTRQVQSDYYKYGTQFFNDATQANEAFQEGNEEDFNKAMLAAFTTAFEMYSIYSTDDPRWSQSATLGGLVPEIEKLEGLKLFLENPEIAEGLDSVDRFYLGISGLSSALKVVTSIASLVDDEIQGSAKVGILIDRVDAINDLLFEAIQFSYQEELRRNYESLLVQTQKNQARIEELSSGIEFSAQEVGQYLLDARSDVVRRSSNGAISVGVDGIVYPPN